MKKMQNLNITCLWTMQFVAGLVLRLTAKCAVCSLGIRPSTNMVAHKYHEAKLILSYCSVLRGTHYYPSLEATPLACSKGCGLETTIIPAQPTRAYHAVRTWTTVKPNKQRLI